MDKKNSTTKPNNKNTLNMVLTCKDFTVTNEDFLLLKDESLDLLITSPQPKLEDLGKYYESDNYISHTDSSKSILDKVYQIAKNYTIGKKVKLVNREERKMKSEEIKKNKLKTSEQKIKTILDIGCGTGDFLAACKKEKWNVVGIEPNIKAAALANSKLQNISIDKNTKNNFSLFKDINELNKENKFDVITMWHVLEHVPNLEEYINNLKRLLKSNGTLIIAVPNYKSFDAKYYKQFWAAYDVPRHLWHFSKKSISLLFKKENMKVVKILPMKLDSYYVSLLSEKYKTGKSNLLKAFFIGFKSNFKALSSKEYSSLIYMIKNN